MAIMKTEELLRRLRETFAQRLQNARKICGLSQAELVEKMKKMAEENPFYKAVSSTAVERYEKAVMYPESDAVMITLATALNTSTDELTRPFNVRIDCSKFEFRKRSKLGKKAQEAIKLKIQQDIERYVEIEQILSIKTNFDVDFSHITVKTANDARRVAIELRYKWKLGSGPILQPIAVLEEHGVKVIEVEEDTELFDGTSNEVEGIPVVVLNKSDNTTDNPKYQNNAERRNLTLFHELGHKIMNIPEEIQNKEREDLCNVFANEMLIPSETFKAIFGVKRQKISSFELKEVQREFGISVRALLMKAYQLEVITANRYKWYCLVLSKKENEEFRKRIDATATSPQHSSRFERLVYRALNMELITTSKAAQMMGMSVSELRKDLDFDNANGSNS